MLIKFLRLAKDLFGSASKKISSANANLIANGRSNDNVRLGGYFNFECKDRDGQLKWSERCHNIWVGTGRNYVLNVIFKNATRNDPLFIGLFKSSGAPATSWSAGNLTVGAGGTWTVFTGFKANRKTFVDDALAAYRVNNNTTKGVFSISASGNIYGAFLATTYGKSAKTGTVLCIDQFASSRTVAATDTVNVTYTVGADDDGV